MTSKSDIYVCLNGGLGNQLFQFAYGLERKSSGNLILDCFIGNPRWNINNKIDLEDFNLGEGVVINNEKPNRFLLRLSNYLLSSKLKESQEFSGILFKVTKAILSFIMSIKNKKLIKIEVANEVGYYDENKAGENYFIGYFQSYKWSESNKNLDYLMNLELKNKSDRYLKLLNEAQKKSKLFVHVRLTDYFHERSIGILKKNYFQDALNLVDAKKSFEEIWLFSDDTQSALKYIPFELIDKIKIVDENLTTAETLQLMRHGDGYIISNSTFSWWASYLRYNRSAKVVAPSPWFIKNNPKLIIPPEWIAQNRC